ncbi:MAG: ABC-F family ATP-binding cassette domain-containing protein [Fusobacteriaceae bacterium]
MNIIEFKDVSKSFFTQKLYKNVNLNIDSKDKIALIGNNGTGKSTLIKLIMDEENPDYGNIIINEESEIACFNQFGEVNLEKKIMDLLNIAFEKVISVQKEMELLGSQFTENNDDNEILLKKYSELSDEFESLGGYSYLHIQSEFIEVFELTDKLEKKFSELSGGEKQYIRLAIILFSQANLIILDEPLSFFDKKKTAWLSNYISESTKAFVIISHNIDFIKSFANKIFDIDNYSVTSYECNYNQFLKEKKIKLAEEKKNIQASNLVIDKTSKAVDKKYILLEKSENKHAQAVILRRMQRELYKLDKEKIERSPEYKYEYTAPPKEVFISSREIEEKIVTLTKVSKDYSGVMLYKDVNLEIIKNKKICIVGENGSGKSTLLKILMGKEAVSSGKVFLNDKAKISYIQQETVFVDETISIIDYLKKETGLSEDFVEVAVDTLYNNEIEFRDKRIFMLSGGEKKRLEIFASILSETDLLVIDEPTTYMDDYSRTTIVDMLLNYKGAIILVSHDKILLKKLNFETYDIRDKRVRIKEMGNS